MVQELVQIDQGTSPVSTLEMQTPDALHRASLADIDRLDSLYQVST
jgi:hypothetical protein